MPIFRVTVEKFAPELAEYWTNRYLVTAANIAAAQAFIDPIVAAERTCLLNTFYVSKARVDDMVPNSDNYDTTSINLVGQRGGTTGAVPLFVVARVDFDVSGGGRPSRKYLRGVLDKSDVSLLQLNPGVITALNTYADAIVAVGGVCDPQGQTFIDGVPWPAAAMRQLRRGSKKKTTP